MAYFNACGLISNCLKVTKLVGSCLEFIKISPRLLETFVDKTKNSLEFI